MVLVFDIGGTHIRSAVSKDGKTFAGPPTIIHTPKEWKNAKETLSHLCKLYEKSARVCIAIAGEFDSERTKLVFSPNLLGWVKKPLKKFFEEQTHASVLLVNDAVAAALAEAREGAGKGYSIVAYLTVGTGVGGARIVDGKVDENRQGFEPGQQIINSATKETLEMRIAGSGFARRFGNDFVKTASKEAWEEAAKEFAVGTHNVLDLWSPDIVVVGGSMVLKPTGISLLSLKKHLETFKKDAREIPPIVKSTFGDESGLRGALLLARD